jgi:predicted AAA+ superfamily ATPase
MVYRRRVVDAQLQSALQVIGGVLIEGPKACGKTETARQVAASEVLLDVDLAAREAMAIDPRLVLDGAPPRLIDEWQIEPAIWDHVRRAIDDRRAAGQFILTGSAVPADDATRHTGAMRIARLRMRPMSMFETGRSTGTVSLASLLAGAAASAPDSGLDVAELAEAVAVGGWPALQDAEVDGALVALRGYLDEVRRVDINRVGPVSRRDPEKVLALLRSLARNVATEVSAVELAKDAGGADGALDDDTVREYLDALARLMVVENQPAWAPHMRSRYILRRAPKRHFVDPSLAVAAVRATPERLLGDLEFFGLLFESLVVRDLRVYAQAVDSAADVRHYRDSQGNECDAIVELPDGRWAAFEIKLGTGRVDAACTTLNTFIKQIDLDKSGAPAALGVIVGRGYAYRRPDGINVIPIGTLGP